jgi:hypothetical protein
VCWTIDHEWNRAPAHAPHEDRELPDGARAETRCNSDAADAALVLFVSIGDKNAAQRRPGGAIILSIADYTPGWIPTWDGAGF